MGIFIEPKFAVDMDWTTQRIGDTVSYPGAGQDFTYGTDGFGSIYETIQDADDNKVPGAVGADPETPSPVPYTELHQTISVVNGQFEEDVVAAADAKYTLDFSSINSDPADLTKYLGTITVGDEPTDVDIRVSDGTVLLGQDDGDAKPGTFTATITLGHAISADSACEFVVGGDYRSDYAKRDEAGDVILDADGKMDLTGVTLPTATAYLDSAMLFVNDGIWVGSGPTNTISVDYLDALVAAGKTEEEIKALEDYDLFQLADDELRYTLKVDNYSLIDSPELEDYNYDRTALLTVRNDASMIFDMGSEARVGDLVFRGNVKLSQGSILKVQNLNGIQGRGGSNVYSKAGHNPAVLTVLGSVIDFGIRDGLQIGHESDADRQGELVLQEGTMFGNKLIITESGSYTMDYMSAVVIHKNSRGVEVADDGTFTNSGKMIITVQPSGSALIFADAFYNTAGVGKITIASAAPIDGIMKVISAEEGDVKVSDITVNAISTSGGEVTAGVHGGNVALASDIDYSTIYLSNRVDEDELGTVVKDSTGASYNVDFNAFKLPASALENGVRDTTTTILIDGTDAAALKYGSETTAGIDGLTFAKDGTNAVPDDPETADIDESQPERNVEFVLTGMDPLDPESYRDLKKGITVEEGVTLTVDKLYQSGVKAVTNINGELRIGTYNTGIEDDPATADVDESVGSGAFRLAAGTVNIAGGGALTGSGEITNTAAGTIKLGAGSTLEGDTIRNAGTITVVSDHATINGAITNHGTINAMKEKLIVVGDIQNAEADDMMEARDNSVITAREFEVTGNVLNYGVIGTEMHPDHEINISGELRNYRQVMANTLTAGSIYNAEIYSEIKEERAIGYIVVGQITTGEINNVVGTISAGEAEEQGIGIKVSGKINNGKIDNDDEFNATIQAGDNGWIQATDALNNIGATSYIHSGEITVVKGAEAGDLTNDGVIATKIIAVDGSVTNSATGIIEIGSSADKPGNLSATSIENAGAITLAGPDVTLAGNVVNNNTFDIDGTVTATGAITNAETGTISIKMDGSLADTGAITNSGTMHIAIQAGSENKIISDAFYNTEGVGKITIGGSCDDGVTNVISAKEGDIKVSDITLTVTAKSGGEVTAGVHGGNVALATGVDYSTIYLSNSIDEDALGTVVQDSTGASYYVDFNAFKLPASALENGVRATTTTILIDGTDAAALKYESETLAALDGLTFAKDGTNAVPDDPATADIDESQPEQNVELVLTGMDLLDPESYRDLKKGITVEEGVTLTLDKVRQTGEDAVTNINGELQMGIFNTKKSPGAKAVVAIDTFEVAAGQVNVNGGGALYDCTVLSGGSVTVYEGGYAEDITMENGGRLDVNEGGVASAATVDFGGDLYVSDGGKALQVTENGGYVNFDEEDVEVTFVANTFSGLTLYGLNWATAHSGTTATDITANSRGTLQIFNGGLANNTTVNSDGRVYVYDGGTVNNATVNSDGSFTVSRGGFATGINASAGARLDFVVAPDTYVQGTYAGSAFEIKDKFIADYTVQSNCWLGASAGGVVSNATVADGGKLCAFEGGIASAPTVDVGGVLYLYEGGSSYEIRENGGAVFGEVTENVSFASNTFSGAVVEDWREATVHSGTTATDTTINADGGMYVFDGGVASDTIVNSDGVLALHEGGTASNATVNVGGEIRVSSGGTATEITENGGYVDVEDGANVTFVSNTISELVLNEYEFATVHSGTTVTDVSINSECELEVFSGGIVGDVAVNTDGALSVYDGGTAIVVTVNEKGVLEVTGGGTVNDVTVNGGGTAEVSSGVIDGTVVNSGGSLLIYSGTKLTGHMTFESGAEVIPFVGSILDFDLTQTSAGSVALVNDLSILMGKPSYTLTVDGNESDGAYWLAGGAAGFNETITVLDFFGEELGTLTVGAEPYSIDGKFYTLALNGSDLFVTIDPGNNPDDGTNDLLYDKKNQTWNDANIMVENWISAASLEQDNTVYLDIPGTIEKHVNNIVMHNMVGYNTPDPDTGDTARIYVEDSAKLTIQIDSTVSGTFYVCEKVYDKKNGAYKQVQVGKVSVKKNKSAYLNDVCLTADGEYFVQMAANSSAYKKADAKGYYNVTIASYEFFDDVDNGWNDSYAKPLVQVEPISIGRETSFVALDNNVESADDWNFVGGITDVADFTKLQLDSSAFLSFNVTGDNAVSDGSAKFTIWKFDGTKGLKKVSSVTLKNGKYAQTTKGVFLDGDEEYYISMESTDAAKGKDLYYKVEVNTLGTRFFDSADDNRNNVLYDKTHKDVYCEDKTHHFVVNEVSAGSSTFSLDDNEIGLDGFENFVGYGDKVDYAKFTVAEKGKLSFTVTATEGATFEVWTLVNGKMKSLGKAKLKLGKNETTCIGSVSNLLLDKDTEYYVSMTATKTTANTKGSVFYNVAATLVPQNASSLTMPETDSLGMADSLSLGQNSADVLADASAFSLAELDDMSGWQSLLA